MSGGATQPFLFPAIRRKKITADFDGRRIIAADGVLLLAAAGRRMGMADASRGSLLIYAVCDL